MSAKRNLSCRLNRKLTFLSCWGSEQGSVLSDEAFHPQLRRLTMSLFMIWSTKRAWRNQARTIRIRKRGHAPCISTHIKKNSSLGKSLTVKCSSNSGSDHRDAVPTSCYLETTERGHASLPALREYLQGLEPDLTNGQHPHHPSFDGEGWTGVRTTNGSQGIKKVSLNFLEQTTHHVQ